MIGFLTIMWCVVIIAGLCFLVLMAREKNPI